MQTSLIDAHERKDVAESYKVALNKIKADAVHHFNSQQQQIRELESKNTELQTQLEQAEERTVQEREKRRVNRDALQQELREVMKGYENAVAGWRTAQTELNELKRRQQ